MNTLSGLYISSSKIIVVMIKVLVIIMILIADVGRLIPCQANQKRKIKLIFSLKK